MPDSFTDRKPCTTCGAEVASQAFACPACGVLLRPNYAVVIVWAGVFLAGLLGFLVTLALR